MVRPNEEAEESNRNRGERNRRVTKDAFAAECADHLRDNTHPRKNHDVNGRVRVEPEEMLKQQRISALRRIEDADAYRALESHEDQSDGQDWSAKDHQDRGSVVRPAK